MLLALVACVADVSLDSGDRPKDSAAPEHIPGDSNADTAGETGETGDTGETGETGETDDTWDTSLVHDTAPYDCADLPATPVEMELALKVTGSEDFTFLNDGSIATVDSSGSLKRFTADGTVEIIRPGLSGAAGTAQLPSGDIVMADRSHSTIVRVGMDGSSEVLTSIPGSPNGLRVGPDGKVYYDDSTGTCYQLDADTKEVRVVSDELYAPNGVVIDNDGNVYVGDDYGWISISRARPEGGWYPAALYSDLPGTDGPMHDCEARAEHDSCFMAIGYGWKTGQCEDDGGGGLTCDKTLDFLACAGSSEGDACSTVFFGTPVENTCRLDSDSGDVYCPRVDSTYEDACGAVGSVCTVGDASGRCQRTSDDVIACQISYDDAALTACEDKASGDYCDIVGSTSASPGKCTEMGGELKCRNRNPPPAMPVDGIEIDECGNLYAADFYGSGVWRWSGPGTAPETLVENPDYWYSLTSMRFGRLGQGFDSRTLYLYQRDKGLHAIATDVPGNMSR